MIDLYFWTTPNGYKPLMFLEETGLPYNADLVAFGKPFVANPDLPARYAAGAALNAPDPATFYGGDERGYTDYPALTPEAAAGAFS